MIRKLFLGMLLLGMVAVPKLFAFPVPVDIGPAFDAAVDVGGPEFQGAIWYTGKEWYSEEGKEKLQDEYFMQAGGNDIWGGWDRFHFAYKTVTGPMRFYIGYKKTEAWPSGWTKIGAMIRAGLEGDAINYYTATRRGQDLAQFQGRDGVGWGSWSTKYYRGDAPGDPEKPHYLGIQRINYRGLPFIEGIVDWGTGAGWERIPGSLRLDTTLPDEVQLGVAMTAHKGNAGAQAWVYGAVYQKDPDPVGPMEFPVLDNPLTECPSVTPGLKIRTIQSPDIGRGKRVELNFEKMNELLDTGYLEGKPGENEGVVIDQVVNRLDSGGWGSFHVKSGSPNHDKSFPGIDSGAPIALDENNDYILPAEGDDEDDFATEVLACIELTEGLHILGVNSDDGAIVWMNDQEVYRTEEYKGASDRDFIVDVATAGKYLLKVRAFERGGGAALELHEVLYQNGQFTRILLGDVEAGGSPVYIPEPATIALLGLGGLSLLRIRRKR